jgi:methionyl-tRNA formyltransferase
MIVDGKRVKVWRARPEPGEGRPGAIRSSGGLATTSGILRLDEVQPEGKPHMSGDAWMAGVHGRALVAEPIEAS